MNCKVIATCFNTGREYRGGAVYPYHNQVVDTREGVLKMLADTILYEFNNDPGIGMDLVIVNNYLPFEEGEKYLASINGLKLLRGRIRVITRINEGGSFGAYNAAFQLFKDEYDHFLFTEDDIMVGGENYYKKIVDKFREGHGFVSLVGTCMTVGKEHAHGGVGLSSSHVLNTVHGPRLPYYGEGWDKEKVIDQGEIPFTRKILSSGYSLVEYGDGKTWNLETNLCIPYYNYVHQP